MTTIYLDQKISTYYAIIWAKSKFGSESFDVTCDFPVTRWKFEFKDSKQATMFALKWT